MSESTPDLPLVSVIVPTFNAAWTLGRTLESVVSQRYPRLEILVVDDASEDDTAALVTGGFPSVRFIRLETNGGVANARNRGVALATGDLIAFLDDDDLWSPDKLRLQVDHFLQHESEGAVMSFTDLTPSQAGAGEPYSASQPVQFHRMFEQLLEGGPILPSCVLMRRSTFLESGGFSEDLVPAEDRDLWLRLAARGAICFLPCILVRRTVHGSNLSHQWQRWERSFDRVVSRFLSRPEGQPFRPRAREYYAFQRVKIGARLLERRRARGLWFLLRAVARDPLALCRRPARPLLIDAAFANVRGWLGLRRAFAFRARLRRLLRVDGGEVATSMPAISYELPPDARPTPQES